MDIHTTISLTPAEGKELAGILGCKEAQLPQKLSEYAKAALTEYVTMFLGQKVFTRGSDILEYRLFLLIKNAFKDRIPDEKDVGQLFQTTATESRGLIRSVMSKYQYLLTDVINQSLRRALAEAKKQGDEGYEVVINSQNVVSALNQTLAKIDGTLPPVAKKRGAVSTYEIATSAYGELSKALKEGK